MADTPKQAYAALMLEFHDAEHHGWGTPSACVVCRAMAEKFDVAMKEHDRALRESHDALVTALREEVGRCPRCHGRGVYSPHCFKCEDSTFDHDDCPPDETCGRCAEARAALAKAEALQ